MSVDSHPLLMHLPISAGDVTVRALQVDDIDDFLAYRSDPEVARYQGWEPMEHQAALAFLLDAVPTPWPVGQWAQVGIARTSDNRLVGDIGLLRETEDQLQIGFSLARSAQGRGWAHAAVGACLRSLWSPLGLRRVRGITDQRNAASIRLLEGLGFVEVSRESVIVRGEPCTDIVMHLSLAT